MIASMHITDSLNEEWGTETILIHCVISVLWSSLWWGSGKNLLGNSTQAFEFSGTNCAVLGKICGIYGLYDQNPEEIP